MIPTQTSQPQSVRLTGVVVPTSRTGRRPVSGACVRTRGRVPSVSSTLASVARRIRASVTAGPTSVDSGAVNAVDEPAEAARAVTTDPSG
jgi:hypothetical protein